MTQVATDDVVGVAEKYYDSSEADEFYFHIWGGEDIHIGLYESEEEPIVRASRRTVEKMASMVQGLGPQTKVLDIGAGYGGAARYLANTFSCHVCCLNLSETQNRRNREITATQGLSDRIEVVHGNFEEIPKADAAFDLVWCQDSILHSGRRRRVLEEVKRVLRPGGEVVFTDPMQADDVPKGMLQPVYDRIHLESLGSFAFYRDAAADIGLEEIAVLDLTEQLPRHYDRVRRELESRYDEMVRVSTKAYVDRMIRGLGHWVDAGRRGHLAWGILHLRKAG